MLRENWTTRDARLFINLQDGSSPLWFVKAELREIVFWTGLGNEWICTFCGSLNGGIDNCHGCNAPPKTNRGRGTALLVISLPDEIDILSLEPGFDLFVLIQRCGRPDVFIEEDIGLSLLGCKVLDAYIPKAVQFYYEDYEHIQLNARIGCQVNVSRNR